MKVILLFLLFTFSFFYPVDCQTIKNNFQFYSPKSVLNSRNLQFSYQTEPSIINLEKKENINQTKENISKKKIAKYFFEFGYLFPSYNIVSEKDHFGTNVPFEKYFSGKSIMNFSVGLYLEIEKNKNIKFLLGMINHYSNIHINFKYDYISDWSDFSDKKYIHKIKSVNLLSPVIGINLYSTNSNSKSLMFFVTARVGLKLFNSIHSKKINVNLESGKEYEDHDAETIIDDKKFYFTLGLGLLTKHLSFNITFSPNLYNFSYTQNEIYYIQGNIFDAKVSVTQIGIAYILPKILK